VRLEVSGAIAMDADEREFGGAGEWALSWNADLCFHADLVGKGSGTYPRESHLPLVTLDILICQSSTIREVLWWFKRDLLPFVTPR
jgi:hypothetical protein